MDKIKNNKDMEINKNINDFDSAIKEKVVNENRTIPKEVSDRIDKTLSELPERKSGVTDTQVENKEKHNYMLYTGVAAACIVFSLVFLLPNVSIAYAKTMAEIPVIGDIIKVVTIRDYKYEDKNHEMDIKVPKVEGKDKNKESVEYINKDVKELTDILIKQFYDDLKTEGSHSTVKVDNEVVTNNNKWFTLKLTVMEISASSNTYYKYYHIDKKDGKRMPADVVANKIYKTTLKTKSKPMIIIGGKMKFLYFFSKFLPLNLWLKITEKYMGGHKQYDNNPYL